MERNLVIASDLSEQIAALCRTGFVVTDDNVFSLYPTLFAGGEPFVIPAGEDSKTLETYGRVARAMLERGCNRRSTVVAVGGGVVGDLAGFVAATFMRGVEWVNVPTTLLSQVDSSVGGKTAVNLGNYKNMIGAFHEPKDVLISTHFLPTLPRREWMCGMGEVVKTMFLTRRVYDLLRGEGMDKMLARDEALTRRVIEECIAYKKSVTDLDPCESGPRKVLNLGHTIGHALETADAHRLSHGEYVLAGLAAEAYVLKDHMDEEFYNEINSAVSRLGAEIPAFDPREIAEICTRDKKNGSGGKISIMCAAFADTREVLIGRDELAERLASWK